MKKAAVPRHLDVSRRERQILDVLFARGRSTAADVQAALPDLRHQPSHRSPHRRPHPPHEP